MIRSTARKALSLVFVATALVTACASQTELDTIVTPSRTSLERVDFSGHWEMDYTRSDDVNQKLRAVIREMNRAADSQATANSGRRMVAAGLAGGGANVVAVARMTDLVTRPEILEIVQDDSSMEVERENDFALTCDFTAGTGQRVASSFGNEICGWDGQQMIFHLTLPDGVVVHHRMTLAADRENLHIATTVSSGASTFTMSRFYARFEPLPTAYKCQDTFSRKRVCSAQAPD